MCMMFVPFCCMTVKHDRFFLKKVCLLELFDHCYSNKLAKVNPADRLRNAGLHGRVFGGISESDLILKTYAFMLTQMAGSCCSNARYPMATLHLVLQPLVRG